MLITTEDSDSVQRIISDAVGLKWSSHYGESGGGFGYFKFSLPRKVGRNYDDIGHGYQIALTKAHGAVRFHGQIRHIEEVSSPEGDAINVTSLGDVVIAQDDELLRHFCDTRLAKWKLDTEIPKGSFRPDLFTTGTNSLGWYVHASNNKDLEAGDYTETVYTFSSDESAQRFKADLSLVLGSGTIFDATVSAIDETNGYVDYANDSGESNVVANMVLYNSTQGKQAIVSAIDTGTNRITVVTASNISGWDASDELAVYGPLFMAQIDSIAAAVITYSDTGLIGEGNLANGQTLTNISKKGVATIQSFNAGANTITVTDEDHMEGWEDTDVIIVTAPYFEATFSSDAGVTITYSNPIGERVASTATGWVLYNVDEDEYAVVDSWNIGSNQLDVSDAGDITASWTNGDTLRIYTPFRIEIRDSADNVLWPASDWRQGAILHDRTSINVTTTGDPQGFKVRFICYIAGSADESSFAQLTSMKVYSTIQDVTATMLAKEVVSLLSASGHDISSSENEIATVTKIVEPMVFEFATPAQAMAWTCAFGDGNGDLLAWGIRLDDTKTLYLEVQDRSTIEYRVKRTGPVSASVTGDVQKSYQQVRGIYTNKLGDQQVTAWQSDTDAYFEGHYRRKSIRVDNVDTDAEAIDAVTLALNDNKNPAVSSKYTVGYGAVTTDLGAPIAIEDLKATGKITMIQDWRAIESGMSGSDIRDTWTKEQIVVVEIDYDAGTATLTPAAARSDFEAYMAELARLAEL